MTQYPTPHVDKLNALLQNDKLPSNDQPRVKQAIQVYKTWIQNMEKAISTHNPANQTSEQLLEKLVKLFNGYKFYIDVFLIFDSQDNFLYRQKGQIKLDNSIIEEFLPRIVHPFLIPEIKAIPVEVGPVPCFSSVYFESSLDDPRDGGGLNIRTKNQDFAISKKLYLKAAHDPDFQASIAKVTNLGYLVAECKTNLDKTMFQEACATARDVKSAIPGAKYFLLCEWLDMPPLSTAPTDIDEVILLRKAKRLSSNVRKNFSTVAGRRKSRKDYIKFLHEYPFNPEMFQHFINHISRSLKNEALVEDDVLSIGYF